MQIRSMGIFTEGIEGYCELTHRECRLSPLFNVVSEKSRHIHMVAKVTPFEALMLFRLHRYIKANESFLLPLSSRFSFVSSQGSQLLLDASTTIN